MLKRDQSLKTTCIRPHPHPHLYSRFSNLLYCPRKLGTFNLCLMQSRPFSMSKSIYFMYVVNGLTRLVRFYSNYHPHLPIVDTTDPPETIFVESPLLFTTIIFIACRHHATYSSLYKQLIPPLNVLISEFSAYPNKHVIDKSIQALLLLCSWPLPFGKQIDDPSWLRCGVITHLAMQNGFHRPDCAQEFKGGGLSTDELRGRTATWLACFLTDFSYAHRNGLEILPLLILGVFFHYQVRNKRNHAYLSWEKLQFVE